VTVHIAIAAGFLTRGRPWWHAPFALVLLPLAPYWGFQDGMRRRAVVWLVAAAVYVAAVLVGRMGS
jgi:hypothetical protein